MTLIWLVRQRFRWLYVTFISLGIGLATILIFPTITATARQHLNTPALTLLITLQSLAGEPARFTPAWQHGWLVFLLGGTALLGMIAALGMVNRKPWGLSLVGQILIPLVILSILRMYPGIRLPQYESRQFLILVPAFFTLVALGLNTIIHRLGWAIPIIIFGATLIASGTGVRTYWHSIKSPEGSLIKRVYAELDPGEAIISLHYSMTASIYAYPTNTEVWVYRGNENGKYHFDRELRLPQIAKFNPEAVPEVALEEIRTYPRFWVLSYPENNPELVATVTDLCSPIREINFSPFNATLWEHCLP